jgi:geranylgeranyl diphosphate synthase, type II
VNSSANSGDPVVVRDVLEVAANAAKCTAVPSEKSERERILAAVRRYVAAHDLVPPLSLEELQGHADRIVEVLAADPGHRNFITVLTGNEVWRETMAGIPYERRVLLLPQCLRTRRTCPAELDELGLLCAQCGACPTGDLQAEAEELGYVVLVAEGTTVVTRLLEQGRVDAVVGVSCLSVLERAFPHMAAHAIPGIAIPLVNDGCDHTQVDLDWVREAIHLRSERRWLGRIDIDRVRSEVESWFQLEPLRRWLGADGTRTEEIALGWLVQSGKRWRPLLAACVFKALTGLEDEHFPETMVKLAVAMECFHKASLVHDDIEDEDDFRYGEMTLHRRHGIPIALNVGDFLLGEGYRLIAETGATPDQKALMLAVVSAGHRSLCLGQGEELCWMRDPVPLSSRKVIELFRRKTAPAFAVALQLGAIAGGAKGEVNDVVIAFSEALGIAFQIRDDLDDFLGQGEDSDAKARRPSLLYALAYENAEAAEQEFIAASWRQDCEQGREIRAGAPAWLTNSRVEEKARQLLEHYRNEAIRSLSPLRNAPLKALLRRLVGKILGGG